MIRLVRVHGLRINHSRNRVGFDGNLFFSSLNALVPPSQTMRAARIDDDRDLRWEAKVVRSFDGCSALGVLKVRDHHSRSHSLTRPAQRSALDGGEQPPSHGGADSLVEFLALHVLQPLREIRAVHRHSSNFVGSRFTSIKSLLHNIHRKFSEISPRCPKVVAMLRKVRVRPALRLDSHLLHPPPIGAVVMTRRVLTARIFINFRIFFKEPSRRVPMRVTHPVPLRPEELRNELVMSPDRLGDHTSSTDPKLLHHDVRPMFSDPRSLAINDVSPPSSLLDFRVPRARRPTLPTVKSVGVIRLGGASPTVPRGTILLVPSRPALSIEAPRDVTVLVAPTVLHQLNDVHRLGKQGLRPVPPRPSLGQFVPRHMPDVADTPQRIGGFVPSCHEQQ